jgi:hypothetical protein
MTANRYD